MSPQTPPNEPTIRIIHFNDVYNVEPRTAEPVGGASRFKTAILSLIDEHSMVLFSGDCVAPSIMSTFTKGEQMIPVLNQCRVDCAVLGNHDFDFGVENLESFMEGTHFPWLMSNVTDIETGKPLAGAKIMHIIERARKKFGLIGLVEEEWLATLSTIDKEDVIYTDYVVEGRKLAQYLKDKENVDYVIALTHMRFPNDCRLAENVEEIDLILGGHDHVYDVKFVKGKKIVKSGSDFREFSKIDLIFKADHVEVMIDKVEITSKAFVEDQLLTEEIERYGQVIEGKMDMVLGHFLCDLDGRFSSIRNQETNLGNFFADIMLTSTNSHLAILNSGTLRSDQIHPKGDFKLRDLVHIMPIMDPMIVLASSGKTIWEALENGVSQWPKLEGRFPQVSGVRFAFDPSGPPGSRVDPRFIKIGDEFLDMDKEYRLVTKAYLYQGKDGYECLKDCKVLISEEECPALCTAIQNHFSTIGMLANHVKKPSRHLQKYVSASKKTYKNKVHEGSSLKLDGSLTSSQNNNVDLSNMDSLLNDVLDMGVNRLEPKVEDRIVILTSQEIRGLLEAERKADLANSY